MPLRLTIGVIIVAAIQQLHPISIMSEKENIIQHDGSIVENVYAIMGRISGYRPRMT